VQGSGRGLVYVTIPAVGEYTANLRARPIANISTRNFSNMK